MSAAKYKHTELGLLPDDWSVVSIGDNAKIFRGGSPRPIHEYITDSPDGVNWIKIGDVAVGAKYISSTVERIKIEGVARSRKVYKGDLILSNSMSFGRPYILNIDGCIHDGWLVIQDFHSSFDKLYLFYALTSELTIKQYSIMAAGSSVQNLSKDKVASVIVALPKDMSEQSAIAAALSDIDELISSLEKLIKKKKAVRQGAMHDLLSGKRRLEGFSGEWDMIRVGNVCTFCKNNTLKRDRLSYTEGSVKNVHYGDVLIKYDYIIDFAKAELPRVRPDFMNKNIGDFLQNGDIIIADAAEDLTVGKACEVTNVNHAEAVAGMDTFLIRLPADLFVHKYLGYYMNIEEYHQQLTRYVQGTKICHLPRNAVLDSCVARPSLEEQAAIISLIDDMSLEIESLFIKLDKYRAIKTGMMNELLTGRIRLIGDDETARDA